MVRVCRTARAAAPAAAVIASSDDDAVTWEDVMDRIAWRHVAVKDSSSAGTGARFLRRSARAAAASLVRAAAAPGRPSWVAVSQGPASEVTRSGEPDPSARA